MWHYTFISGLRTVYFITYFTCQHWIFPVYPGGDVCGDITYANLCVPGRWTDIFPEYLHFPWILTYFRRPWFADTELAAMWHQVTSGDLVLRKAYFHVCLVAEQLCDILLVFVTVFAYGYNGIPDTCRTWSITYLWWFAGMMTLSKQNCEHCEFLNFMNSCVIFAIALLASLPDTTAFSYKCRPECWTLCL